MSYGVNDCYSYNEEKEIWVFVFDDKIQFPFHSITKSMSAFFMFLLFRYRFSQLNYLRTRNVENLLKFVKKSIKFIY